LGLADYQHVATYPADTWGCVAVRAEQPGPGVDPAAADVLGPEGHDIAW
jgi:hypothetical protein